MGTEYDTDILRQLYIAVAIASYTNNDDFGNDLLY